MVTAASWPVGSGTWTIWSFSESENVATWFPLTEIAYLPVGMPLMRMWVALGRPARFSIRNAMLLKSSPIVTG